MLQNPSYYLKTGGNYAKKALNSSRGWTAGMKGGWGVLGAALIVQALRAIFCYFKYTHFSFNKHKN